MNIDKIETKIRRGDGDFNDIHDYAAEYGKNTAIQVRRQIEKEFPEKNALEWQEDPNNKEKPGSVDHQHFPVRSGQRDLNPRPLDPQSSALPSYAIPGAACFLLPATANIPKIKAFVNWSSSKIIRQLFCCVCLCKGLQSLLWALRPFLCCAGKCGRIGAAAKEETR